MKTAREIAIQQHMIQEIWAKFSVRTKINQRTAAKAMGYSQSSFSQYLNAFISPNTDFILAFCALTKTAPQDLLPELNWFIGPLIDENRRLKRQLREAQRNAK